MNNAKYTSTFDRWFTDYSRRLHLTDLVIQYIRPELESAWQFHRQYPSWTFFRYMRGRYGNWRDHNLVWLSEPLLHDAWDAAISRHRTTKPVHKVRELIAL